MNSPAPDQIRKWRETFPGATVREQRAAAGESVGVGWAAVRSWELGNRDMPAGLWLLARAQAEDCSPNALA